MKTVICHIKEYIQPFERHLALEELQSLSGSKPVPVDGEASRASRFSVEVQANPDCLKHNLAYWERVGMQEAELTHQSRAEATYMIARNGVALDDLPSVVPGLISGKVPNKRCLRYATHGLHEYRGKFFPQLVRALINIANVPSDGIVMDPMSGSGTTLIEAMLSGRKAYGLDMNPLSVFMADVKCKILGMAPLSLIDAFHDITASLASPNAAAEGESYFSTLPAVDQTYLLNWFSENTLRELDVIQAALQKMGASPVRNLFLLCLSNILRGVSWQKNDDLRVRKEVIDLAPGEVTSRFLDEVRKSIKTVVAYMSERGTEGIGEYRISLGDAGASATLCPHLQGKVDAIITSPPYATALPYLDTDRLSLVYLGLLSRPEHRKQDLFMIGNREVTEKQRAGFWTHYMERRDCLPPSTRELIERIHDLNSKDKGAGFRRRNLSALLAKYFLDMREVIAQQHILLKPGGMMFMVVGNNRTLAGGEEISIETVANLSRIAEMQGFRVSGQLSMDMLVSRDIFKKNANPSEYIISLQKA